MEISAAWENGNTSTPTEGAPAPFAGPKLVSLSDGRVVASGRNLGLWLLDVETGLLTQFAQPIGNSYPGVVEYEEKLWVTSGTANVDAVVFSAFDIPAK
ncbi:MAG: hypothetical protein O2955_12605 [Planctomycetota bacterium]|nr:hypothetical protein [Planctomycetota bacterium]MDA1213351.1 hypothetical protein [Planctomycetota bacterium]